MAKLEIMTSIPRLVKQEKIFKNFVGRYLKRYGLECDYNATTFVDFHSNDSYFRFRDLEGSIEVEIAPNPFMNHSIRVVFMTYELEHTSPDDLYAISIRKMSEEKREEMLKKIRKLNDAR